jgi:lycopene beta-cyclase
LIIEKHYDYVLTGGGAAGLSLALAIKNSPLVNRSILIVDRQVKNINDRTWCFWSKAPTAVDPVISNSWNELFFFGKDFTSQFHLKPFSYHLVHGIDFYEYAQSLLKSLPGVDFLQADVQQILDSESNARVVTNLGIFSGEWIFDSRFIAADFHPDPNRYHYIKQHFLGWEIETSQPAFSTQSATLFDFRTPQNGSMRFFYVLPFDERRALVEYTLFSAELLEKQEYQQAITSYLSDVLKIKEYTIKHEEFGVIPMTDQPFNRRAGKRVLNIGTRGGRVKPSSGYAFKRILQDSEAIVRSLITYADPFHLPKSPLRYQWFDTLLLQILYRQGQQGEPIFTALFKNNPIDRIFEFLDETAGIPENLKLIASLPPLSFLKALFRTKILKRI